jgi:peptidoglycan hydrolase-like protein with peptidoglycan-binding domain
MEQPSQTTAASPASPPAAASNLPDEPNMSDADRRQVQEALQHLDYYRGSVDGIFGPLTRAAIRRFQDSIGAKSTGYLTAAEANRLVNAH